MDTLSDLLRVIRLAGGMFFRIDLRAPYSVKALDVTSMAQRYAPDATQVLPFHVLLDGSMWIDIADNESVELQANDIIVLPRGHDHVVTDKPGRVPVDTSELGEYICGEPPCLAYGGEGARGVGLCGFFKWRSRLFNPLLEALPDVLVIRNDPERTPWLTGNLRRAYDETVAQRPGGEALVERLTELLFIEVVHRHLDGGEAGGWLAGLADPIVSRALQQIHAAPAHAWTVAELGRKCGASRSLLAARFQETVGLSPIRYLSEWRMERAAQRLVDTDDALAEIAAAVGYDSVPAFNQAFKRHVGEPPGRWRRRHQSPSCSSVRT